MLRCKCKDNFLHRLEQMKLPNNTKRTLKDIRYISTSYTNATWGVVRLGGFPEMQDLLGGTNITD
jgi:hypothetical protein